VKDNGIGMSNEIMKDLFVPQMKSLSVTRKKNKGAGIGLILVKEFIEKNGGVIWAESLPGIGSSFYFTLPIEKMQHKTGNSTEIMFDENSGLKIW
jgi:two-component system CheB/CheR fusion protein